MALSNYDMDEILGKYSGYLGTLSKDKLRFQDPKKVGYYILNLQSTNQGDKKGTHFVLLANLPTYLYYHDSFGCYIVPKVVKEFAKKAGKEIYTSDSKFQHLDSIACGWHVILVALLLEQGNSPKKIVDKILPSMIQNYKDLDPSE
jgi:hypothetical protein